MRFLCVSLCSCVRRLSVVSVLVCAAVSVPFLIYFLLVTLSACRAQDKNARLERGDRMLCLVARYKDLLVDRVI